MANILEFDGYKPVIKESAFVHPDATITGNVIVGKNTYIGPGARLRGDWGKIIIEDGCNVQENCTIHMFPGITVRLEKGAHMGHGAVVHGSHIGENCLIGMNSVIMDRVSIGRNSIVGALTFIREGTDIPERKVVAGNPGEIVKEVTDEMLEWKSKGTDLYQQLPEKLADTLKPCAPHRSEPEDRVDQKKHYKTWIEWKNSNKGN